MPRLCLSRTAAAVSLAALAWLAFSLLPGCGEAAPLIESENQNTQTAIAAPYQRRPVDFYKGISEPRAGTWQEMVRESGRLLEDGFNTVTLSPPVNITARAGGQPRVIFEGEAAAAEMLTEDFHAAGFAVHLAPTTVLAGFGEQVEPTDAALAHLEEDTLRWAAKAESNQAELFSPLSRYNLVLGTEAADRWSAKILPQVRERYQGPVAARVVPDLGTTPAMGAPHDFEQLDYRGYDFLMLDIFPQGESFDATAFQSYAADILIRAAGVAERDGLKGILVEFGAWREPAGADALDGPILGEDAQAAMAGHFLENAVPRTQGVFFHGWTLPGRGARDYPVEKTLKEFFGR